MRLYGGHWQDGGHEYAGIVALLAGGAIAVLGVRQTQTPAPPTLEAPALWSLVET